MKKRNEIKGNEVKRNETNEVIEYRISNNEQQVRTSKGNKASDRLAQRNKQQT